MQGGEGWLRFILGYERVGTAMVSLNWSREQDEKDGGGEGAASAPSKSDPPSPPLKDSSLPRPKKKKKSSASSASSLITSTVSSKGRLGKAHGAGAPADPPRCSSRAGVGGPAGWKQALPDLFN